MSRKIEYKIKDILTKDVLYDLYVSQEMSTVQIAKLYDCTNSTVGRLLKNHGIQIRQKRAIKYVLSKEELYDLYINKNMTTYEIGVLVGFDEVPVQRLLKAYEIPKKVYPWESLDKETLHELRFVKYKTVPEIAKMYGCCKNTIAELLNKYDVKQKPIEERLSRDVLYDLYLEQDKTKIEIAKIYRTRVKTISELLKKYDIQKDFPIEKLKVNLSKRDLCDLYINEDLSRKEIGILFDCSPQTVGRVLDEYGISKEKEFLGDILTKDVLENLYVNQNKSAKDISDEYDCSSAAIEILLKRYDIETRRINDYVDIGRDFESLVKESFDALNYGYEYQYEGFEGVRVDFYDKENDTILDAKLSSHTPFIKTRGRNFFEKHKGMSDKVIIVYLRGHHIDPRDNFEWRHMSYYYPKLKEIGRDDLVEKISELAN